MKNYISKIMSVGFLVVLLPVLGGCVPGGGSGGSSSGFLPLSGGGSGGGGSAGQQIAMVHNPEPASMLLLGSGLAGLAISRRKKKS